ncbi:MAG: hypothetical protein U0835_11945 [Isosphaeraceae bacterium]
MHHALRKHPRIAAAVLVGLATTGAALAQQAALVGTLDGHTDPVYSVAWSKDGKLLVTGGFDNSVRLWDPVTRKEIKKFEGHSNLVLAVAPSPDGKTVLGEPRQVGEALGRARLGRREEPGQPGRRVGPGGTKPDGKRAPRPPPATP